MDKIFIILGEGANINGRRQTKKRRVYGQVDCAIQEKSTLCWHCPGIS